MRKDEIREFKRIILVVCIVILSFCLFFVYFRIEFGRFAEKRSALSAKMDAHGPWAEQGIWAADDGSAYMLPSDDPYVPTAYFFIRGEWYDFEMICGPGCILWFSDRDAEFDVPQFKSNFKLEGDTFTLHIKRQNTDQIRPKRHTYVLTKAADYEQALAALPFAPADS